MIDIEKLQEYYERDRVIISLHAQERLRQRGIKARDVRNCIMTGEIIEQYPEDFPFPSCLIFGYTVNNKIIHVVASDEGTMSRIITAYYPDTLKFEDDLRTRRGAKIMKCMSCKYGEMKEAKTTYFAQLNNCYVDY